MKTEYPDSFLEWWSIIEDKARSDLGDDSARWLFAAWCLGQIANEKRSDGHAAEALKAVRASGFEGADIVASLKDKVYSDSRRTIESNIKSIALNGCVSKYI